MMNRPRNYEFIQTKYTSNSRGTRMGRRIVRNVNEMAQYLKPPVCCVGCGDGWEVEQLAKAMKIPIEKESIIGAEVTKERVSTALANKVPVIEGMAENLVDLLGEKSYNIYCVHTLEHCYDRDLAIANFKKVAIDTIVIIVPVEVVGRTRNRAHFSPIANMGYIANLFGMDWKVINLSYRWNIELEGVLVLKRNPMNWPNRCKLSRRKLFIKGSF